MNKLDSVDIANMNGQQLAKLMAEVINAVLEIEERLKKLEETNG